MKIPFLPFAAAAALFASGCADLFSSSPAQANPYAWRPQLPVAATLDDLATGTRPLRSDDRVTVTLHATALDGPQRHEDIVDGAGYITLPLINDVRVGGLTTSEAEKVIADTYMKNGIYNKIAVTVVCQDMIQEQTYSVTGEMSKRGLFPYKEGMTLLEAVIQAGDLTKFANGTVVLTRNGVSTTYDLDRIRRGKDADPLIRPRDIIEAKPKWM
ncbi:MAG: polysaccharide biosynthesis/export family protein [Kiritimatiellae bacterium]|jgi:protein involved in polysaccharide export with SLBB domain|nr:polysaccharide biosynthesis/export family protein [Kiritimatiellia bacterium]